MFVYGNYDSYKARLLSLQLVKCHDKDYCKSPEEITSFFRRKYFYTLSNSIRFDAQYYGEQSIIKESTTKYSIINTQAQVTIPFKV